MKKTLYAIGEALIDFIPSENGCNFSDVTSFSPKVGGAPANVLGAFSKLGGKTQLITQLGDDPFGHKIKDYLEKYNVGTDNVMFSQNANTALAFVSLGENGNRTFSFYRNPSADMLYSAENINKISFDDCYALHFCSVSLGNFPMKEAHKKAVEFAKDSGAIICFDPNLRFPLWKSTVELKKAVDEFLPLADIIKVSDEEIGFITGTENIGEACERLLANSKLVICTCGKNGSYAYTGGINAYAPSKDVAAVDTTGAGDAFIGSFLYSLQREGYDKSNLQTLTKEKLTEFLYASNNYCAESVQGYGAIESYPDYI